MLGLRAAVKRVMLVMISNSDSCAMPTTVARLLVSYRPDSLSRPQEQAPSSPNPLSPYPQPLKETENTSCRNYPLHSYSGDGSYLHPTLQRRKSVTWVRVKNTGESVLQGKVNTPATHLSKDTW